MSSETLYFLGHSVLRSLRRGPMTLEEEQALERLEDCRGTRDDLLRALDLAHWRNLGEVVSLILRTLDGPPDSRPKGQLRLLD